MAKIKQNRYVLFFYNSSKKWLVKISKKEQLHTHIGVIKHSDAIGKEYGSRLTTNKDKYVYLLEPTIHDFILKIKHGTQIVYPKDLGYIVARSGLQSGQKVVEIVQREICAGLRRSGRTVARRRPTSDLCSHADPSRASGCVLSLFARRAAGRAHSARAPDRDPGRRPRPALAALLPVPGRHRRPHRSRPAHSRECRRAARGSPG